MRKKARFVGKLFRIEDNSLTKQILKYLQGKKSISSWIKDEKTDLGKK